jgi:ATP-binding protein involved in chromosome partitioning
MRDGMHHVGERMSLIQIGKKTTTGSGEAKPDLRYGTSMAPNNRAGFARVVIGVTSGKGGVGKTTVAVNLAVGLAQRGLKVGLLDADVYGPSVARMMLLQDEKLRWGEDKMIPAENFGVKVMSTALTTPEDDTPLAWRSSVATSALVQLLDDVDWGPLDVLIIDMPPGTGDVQITMVQEVRLTGAVVVTTPQLVAVDDVRRAMRMLLDVKAPILGVVENMSWYEAADGSRHTPFGEGGGALLAERYGAPLLGQFPLKDSVRASCDDGMPAVATGADDDKVRYRALVDAVLARPEVRARLGDDRPIEGSR